MDLTPAEQILKNVYMDIVNNPKKYENKKRVYHLTEEEKRIAKLKKEHNIGRNDTCPCGSGLKFKKCCGRIKGE